ncbi:ral GTPase-activating protein subunit beta [Leuresthes tenuis]|uniref:ral GTPase-activating protein subunit beta n=1 Tax=Leuresthes tenuis TaxID=355514 RepID=UPI003B507D9E
MDQSLAAGQLSVLSCFPSSSGRDVVVAVVKPLGAGLGNPNTRSLLHTDRQVKWTLEVLCYGLTLPLDRDIVKICVDIYTDWLMALVSQRNSTPPPISRNPNLYAQRILRNLYLLFLPRSDQVSLVHLSLCQQVLFTVKSLAKESGIMSRETWEALLHFLLRINHAMLAPPTAAGGVSDLSMAVLLEVWLLSCSQCFPSRSLWQTCRQMLNSWRHQPIVVQQWCRVVNALTSRLLPLTFGSHFPNFEVRDEDAALVPCEMEDDRIPHIWLRFLHMFSNPADVSRPAISALNLVLRDDQLPDVFFRAMKGINGLVDAFLGVSVSRGPFRDRLPVYGFSRPRSGSAPPTPVNIFNVSDDRPSKTLTPPHKRRMKVTNVSKVTDKLSVTSSSQLPLCSPFLASSPRCSPSYLRCNVDSLLHLFGCWLFDAALISRDSDLTSGRQDDVTMMSERWAEGQAEACGTLCRIFTCKKTSENILSVYLSRFYLVLLQSLQEDSPPVVASILMNSTGLFCSDLRGVNLLLPPFISALQNVMLDRELMRFKGFVNSVDLRRATIFILLSLLPLPLHFGSVQSQISLDGKLNADDVTAGKFLSLKPHLINLLIGALQTEMDISNIQLILAAMLNLVQDSTLFEVAGRPQWEAGAQQVGGSQSQRTSGASGLSAKGWARSFISAAALWVHVVRLLTQCLTSQWKNDSAVCLSALEVLGGLAKVEVKVEESERRHAVSSVCTYIVFQCSRPPPLHSRDLHSIIVAAFYCLNTWLTHHPSLLDDQECLSEVLEIVELGISGSKSTQEEKVRCKDEKELNPASLRVKEAAEATLSCVMQVSGASLCVGASLNEDALIGCCSLSESSLKKFRYFVLEGSVILAILDKGPGPEQEHPALTVVIRGPSGHHTWSLQLQLQPREARALAQLQKTLIPEQRGVTEKDAGQKGSVQPRLFPETNHRVPSVQADLSVPALHDTVTMQVQQKLEHLHKVLKSSQHFITDRPPLVSGTSVVTVTCRPPPPVTHFQASRLFLSHMGLLTPESIKDPGVSGVPPQLLSLDSSLPGFSEDLRSLDQLPSKIHDSVFVFYMRGGQKTAAEILRNVEDRCHVQSHFLDFLSSLGWPADVQQQQVGRVIAGHSEFPAALGNSGGAAFDGRRFVLMSTDALTAITFIIPSLQTYNDWLKSSQEVEPPTESPINRQSHSKLNTDSAPKSIISVAEEIKFSWLESKLLIVWLERYEDLENFPLSELLTQTSASHAQLIFIHPLKTGLYRIRFHGNVNNKLGLVTPLVNGSVVSRRSLGFLVREMVINCCNRRRLESDSTPPPHIKRKHMISDIILRYRCRRSEPDFYSALFHDL